MSFFSAKKKPTYFITKSFKEELQEKSDLVLSPEFYWVKKVELNLKYTYEAKKMAPSVFDGILPVGDFDYRVFKVATKEFVFIAYDISDIIDKLEKMGIDMKKVDKIYTLQSEFINKDIALKIDDKYAIVSNDGVMTYAPARLLNTRVEIKISDILREKKLTGNYIYSKSFQKTGISQKHSNQIMSLLILLVLVLLVDQLRIQKKRDLIVREKNRLVQTYSLPRTSFQIKSIYSELLTIDKEQNSLKKAVEYMGKFKLLKGEFFTSFSYKKPILKFVIKLNSKRRQKEFDAYVSKNYKVLKRVKSKNGYMIEVGL